MKIFKKLHHWKDNRTFLELDASEPSKERGFAKEGNILLKIGQQSNVKSAFKLSIDEARAMRDTIDMFLRFHDMKMSEFMTDQQNQYQKVPDYYQRDPDGVREDEYSRKEHNHNTSSNYSSNNYSNEEKSSNETAPLFLFSQNEDKKDEKIEEKEDRVDSEFYF